VCGALDRHRLIHLYMTQKTDLFGGDRKKMLHVAPEYQVSRLFEETDCIDYLSADLSSPAAMVKMDVTDIQYADDSFDVIYCSHVLEHVSDDRRAMREFYRVLKPGGWAILQVPMSLAQRKGSCYSARMIMSAGTGRIMRTDFPQLGSP
jgi:SAM-dependent methyltransferase